MIFVTGGTGFLGKNMIPLLAAQGYRLRALVRRPDEHLWLQEYGVEVIRGDLLDAEAVQKGISGCQYVIHAGGRFRMWGKAEDFWRTNVRGTATVLEAAARAGVERLVHVSTIAVVGTPIPGRIVDETHPTCPGDAYQQSKLEGEQVVLRYLEERGLPAIILRPGAFYGPHGHYAFNRLFFEDPLKGLLIKVAHGNNFTFPAYIGDVAAAIASALTLGRVGEIYNISGDPLTHNEANNMVSEEAGITPFRFNAPAGVMLALARAWTWLSYLTHVEPYYPFNLRLYVFNNWMVSSQKARDELNFRPTPFREGVRRTLAWYRQIGFYRAKQPH